MTAWAQLTGVVIAPPAPGDDERWPGRWCVMIEVDELAELATLRPEWVACFAEPHAAARLNVGDLVEADGRLILARFTRDNGVPRLRLVLQTTDLRCPG